MSDIKETKDNIQEMVIREFGFEDLSDEKQQELVNYMTETVIKRVLVEAYAKLSELDQKTFEEMMENIEAINPNDVEEFLREKLTDYDEIVVEAVDDLKKHLLEKEDVADKK